MPYEKDAIYFFERDDIFLDMGENKGKIILEGF